MTPLRPNSGEPAEVAAREIDELAAVVTDEVRDQFSLNREHRHSRWHEENPSATHRESWACIPVADAVHAVMAAAHRAALRDAAHRPDGALDVERLRRIEHAARDVDGAWSESRNLIHWQPEAGEALRDLRAALAAADKPSPEPAYGGVDVAATVEAVRRRRAALAAPGDEALRTALEAIAREAATLVAEEPYGDQDVAIDARMRLRARLTDLSDLRSPAATATEDERP